MLKKLKVREVEIYESDVAVVKNYRPAFKLTYYKQAQRIKGFETDKKRIMGINDEKLDRNIYRAKSKLFEYGLCNDWQYFVTLTIDPLKYNRNDLVTYHRDLGIWLTNYNYRNACQVKYLLIPEKHKNGAWHMHGLMSGIPAEALKLNKFNYLSWQGYENKFGYISLGVVRNKDAVSKYITKYICKDLEKSVKKINAHLYYCSRGLNVADVVRRGICLHPEDIPPNYENERVKVYWTSNSLASLDKYFSDI